MKSAPRIEAPRHRRTLWYNSTEEQIAGLERVTAQLFYALKHMREQPVSWTLSAASLIEADAALAAAWPMVAPPCLPKPTP